MKTLHEVINEVSKEKYDCSFVYAMSFINSLDVRDLMNVAAIRFSEACIRETIEICNCHADDGYFDKEGALVNSLKILS